MSWYTNKKVSWEAHSPQNQFGDMQYEEPILVNARKEPHEEIVKTSEGKEVMSKHIIYVCPPEGTKIDNMDKLDGEIIISKYTMCSLGNKPVLVRFITA